MKNEDQKIQTPFKSENYIGEEYLGEFEELDEDISNLGDDNKSLYLSRQDYEASLIKESKSELTIMSLMIVHIKILQMILLLSYRENII